MEKLLLRPSEAAELLGIARSRTYMLIASGELPSVRIGKSVRVPVAALQEWIDALRGAEDASTDGTTRPTQART